MTHELTLEAMIRDPQTATTQVQRNGQAFTVRPLQAGDAQPLADYFAGLSDSTRSWFAPHKFTSETAREFCDDLLSLNTLRMVAVAHSPDKSRFAAYFLLQLGIRPQDAARYDSYGLPLNDATDCTVAPSVADDFQSYGLGSAMMMHAIDLARRVGKKRMLLFAGVNADNRAAVHFYEKFGFRTVGVFGKDADKLDMIRDLAEQKA